MKFINGGTETSYSSTVDGDESAFLFVIPRFLKAVMQAHTSLHGYTVSFCCLFPIGLPLFLSLSLSLSLFLFLSLEKIRVSVISC